MTERSASPSVTGADASELSSHVGNRCRIALVPSGARGRPARNSTIRSGRRPRLRFQPRTTATDGSGRPRSDATSAGAVPGKTTGVAPARGQERDPLFDLHLPIGPATRPVAGADQTVVSAARDGRQRQVEREDHVDHVEEDGVSRRIAMDGASRGAAESVEGRPFRARALRGDVHSQTIDGFWSLIKREIDGTHHAVSQKWLQGYI